MRDSGIAHALLNISEYNDLICHPVAGGSWEGFVIENIISVCPSHFNCFYYRTAQGAEIDLIIEIGHNKLIAIEIKKSSSPTISKGFHIACEDINAYKKFVVYSGDDNFSLGNDVTAISLKSIMELLLDMDK